MYHDSASIVRTSVGDTEHFQTSVGVDQGSALSPFLFIVVFDNVSNHIQDQREVISVIWGLMLKRKVNH